MHFALSFFTAIAGNKAVSTILTLLVTLLLFGVLIFLHELGHYLTARLFKVTVKEFSIGMGPKIWGKSSGKTGIQYSVRAFPIGGYVSMEGENEESEDPNAFCKKKTWQRMIITGAGAAMNILLGVILAMIYVATMPKFGGTTVVNFDKDALSSTGEYALMEGDEILSIDGSRVRTVQEVIYELFRKGQDGSVEMVVRRNGEKITLKEVKIPVDSEGGTSYGSMDFYCNMQSRNAGNFIKNTYCQMRLTVKMVYESLFDLLRGRYGIDQVSGPVGTAGAVGDAIKQDVNASPGQSRNSFIYICLMITVNLGLFNLLPIPALDGGRLFFQFIELIIRRPVPAKFENTVHLVGILLLLALMLVITFKDIVGIFV